MFRIHNLLALAALASMVGLTTAARANDQTRNADNQNRAEQQQQAVKGTVQSVSQDHRQIVVRDQNNRDWAIQIAKDARVRVDDKEAQASDLKDGDQVTVNFRQVAQRVMATQGEKACQFTAGRVQRASENQLTIKNHQGQEETFQVAQNTDVRANGQSAKLSNLKEGEHVVVAYTKNGDNREANEVIAAGEQGRGAGWAAGKVESVSADHNQIVLKDQNGNEHTFQLGHDAQVRVNNREGRASDLQQGNQAAVAFSRVATEVTGSRGNK